MRYMGFNDSFSMANAVVGIIDKVIAHIKLTKCLFIFSFVASSFPFYLSLYPSNPLIALTSKMALSFDFLHFPFTSPLSKDRGQNTYSALRLYVCRLRTALFCLPLAGRHEFGIPVHSLRICTGKMIFFD